MDDKQLKWEDVWKMPLHLDDHGFYVWDNEGKMALMFYENEQFDDDPEFAPIALKIRKSVIDQINGTGYIAPFTIRYEKGEFINNRGDHTFCVRGYGHLTGTGALNLSAPEAIRLQDEFGEYIITQLVR